MSVEREAGLRHAGDRHLDRGIAGAVPREAPRHIHQGPVHQGPGGERSPARRVQDTGTATFAGRREIDGANPYDAEQRLAVEFVHLASPARIDSETVQHGGQGVADWPAAEPSGLGNGRAIAATVGRPWRAPPEGPRGIRGGRGAGPNGGLQCLTTGAPGVEARKGRRAAARGADRTRTGSGRSGAGPADSQGLAAGDRGGASRRTAGGAVPDRLRSFLREPSRARRGRVGGTASSRARVRRRPQPPRHLLHRRMASSLPPVSHAGRAACPRGGDRHGRRPASRVFSRRRAESSEPPGFGAGGGVDDGSRRRLVSGSRRRCRAGPGGGGASQRRAAGDAG